MLPLRVLKSGEAASNYIDLSTTDIEESELTVEHRFRAVKKVIKKMAK